MRKKKTTEEFVEKADIVHEGKYDYSKVNYINNRTPVCIICPIHGEFPQTPNKHISEKRGCKFCAIENKTKTTNKFIEDARKVQGYKYDYSKVNYINSKTPVCIICPIHGEFPQKPSNHLGGQGCPKCIGRDKTTEEWVKQAKIIHGDFYDYSKVNYKKNNIKVCIICPIHGEFPQEPKNHLNGHGCSECGNIMTHMLSRKTTKEFIEKADIVHNNKYDYSKVNYINNKTPVCIICPIHGEFPQKPHNHLNGKGCPYCSESKLEKHVTELLNRTNILFNRHYRGFSWLKNKKKLELDFYLPDHCAAIECQGKQHINADTLFGKDEKYGFEYTKKNDEIKKQLCEKNGISLYYINYNEDVEQKLNQIILEIHGKERSKD